MAAVIIQRTALGTIAQGKQSLQPLLRQSPPKCAESHPRKLHLAGLSPPRSVQVAKTPLEGTLDLHSSFCSAQSSCCSGVRSLNLSALQLSHQHQIADNEHSHHHQLCHNLPEHPLGQFLLQQPAQPKTNTY
ncbi:hypothetical protein WJX74_009511 [Apatococcus lobatus]|uniref:Uncharacterized protein n=1 Tax=Apatococcus lobatus TaxID=904363 RepID=A0AAW1RHM4_9CHLO